MTGELSPQGLDGLISAALLERGIVHERERPGVYLVRLEGEHKLVTQTLLVVGEHSLLVEAFFVRRPDENHAEFYRWLLERNARMYGVHFSLDRLGDVYLVGRLPAARGHGRRARPATRLRADVRRRGVRPGA